MRVFVAGATGVLGRRAVRLLVADGHEVTAVARTDAKARALRAQGAVPTTVDLFDPGAVRAAVDGHDAVVNLATCIPPTSRMLFASAWRANDRLRQDASRHLVDAALVSGVSRVIQESITFGYADGGDTWLDEDAPVDARGVTASSRDAEETALGFARGGGTAVVLRFAMLVAPESGHTRDLVQAVEAGWLPLLGLDDAYESFVDADDAANAVRHALDLATGTYNVAEDRPTTNAEHVAAFATAVGRSVRRPPARLGRLPRLKLRARSQRVSNRRLRDASTWRPATPCLADSWPDVIAATRSSAPACS